MPEPPARSSTTVLTWLVRAPMARSISSVDAMSLGMLLRFGVSISQARSTLFPISNFADNRPPAVGRSHFNITGRWSDVRPCIVSILLKLSATPLVSAISIVEGLCVTTWENMST
ncbi:hypothetical protein EVAR_90114_1 [Eumeta japonica]|uniref:Uncharacterized protein n=1 Tax=Eumeta variegata TaxID=151549 RepID=A0A4C2A0N2_EUMVA|nr:hypothetical protein EVAR_90114_1 [Eumeta japonica]